ncbi:hypothetical protein MIR68_002891 [Amoeboaphelidium protococcarum]|nr:hypothetical protein MIR68_002891 [Amoeboaphelidium protococcarum]KAI3653564.1 hypothetical protein MP228_001511 [Amoeboaphelidium protococcarum]
MKNVRVLLEDADKFNYVLKEQLSGQSKVFAVFYGAEDQQTGESWCPDCVMADPKIRQNVAAIEDSVLISCSVGSRSEWKQNPQHPYKVNPLLKISRIPTLLRFASDGSVQAKLVEDECLSDANYKRLQ